MKSSVAFLCFLGAFAVAQAPSSAPSAPDSSTSALVEAAKKTRENDGAKAKRVYTNDDLPLAGDVNVVGKAGSKPHRGSGDPVHDQDALDRQWQSRIQQQKDKIANLERQLELAQKALSYTTRPDPIKPNAGYARDKAKIDSLEQQIADAKDKLSQMQDEAHKAGADKAYD